MGGREGGRDAGREERERERGGVDKESMIATINTSSAELLLYYEYHALRHRIEREKVT